MRLYLPRPLFSLRLNYRSQDWCEKLLEKWYRLPLSSFSYAQINFKSKIFNCQCCLLDLHRRSWYKPLKSDYMYVLLNSSKLKGYRKYTYCVVPKWRPHSVECYVNISLPYNKKYQVSLKQRVSMNFKWLHMTKQASSPLSKSVCGQPHVGSNPTRCAKKNTLR